MKKRINLLFVIGIPVLFIFLTSGIMYPTGSPGGKTGSPGDNGANCTDCHSGTPQTAEMWIYSPELLLGGYSPSQSYMVLVYGIDGNANKFGFEATAENSDGDKVGSLTPGMGGFTQYVNNNQAISHTVMGTIPLTDTGTFWTFQWTAPLETEGEITFYAAINAANGDGTNDNDQIYLSSFSASPATGIFDRADDQGLSLYPNPSSGMISLNETDLKNNDQIEVIDLSGRVQYAATLATRSQKIDLGHLDKGIYIVRIGKRSERLILH